MKPWPGDVLAGRFRVVRLRHTGSDRWVFDAVDLAERRPVRIEWPMADAPGFADEAERARRAWGSGASLGLWSERGRWFAVGPRREPEVRWSDLHGLDVPRALTLVERVAWALARYHAAVGPHGALRPARIRVCGADVTLGAGVDPTEGTVADDVSALGDLLAGALGRRGRSPWDPDVAVPLPRAARDVLDALRSPDPARRPESAGAAALLLRQAARHPRRAIGPVRRVGVSVVGTHQVRRLDEQGRWARVGRPCSAWRAASVAEQLRARGEYVAVVQVRLGPSDAAWILGSAIVASPVVLVGPVLAAWVAARWRVAGVVPGAATEGEGCTHDLPRARPPIAWWTFAIALWATAVLLWFAPAWAWIPVVVAAAVAFVLWAPERPVLGDALDAARWSAALVESDARAGASAADLDGQLAMIGTVEALRNDGAPRRVEEAEQVRAAARAAPRAPVLGHRRLHPLAADTPNGGSDVDAT